jgi:hypothetical protein
LLAYEKSVWRLLNFLFDATDGFEPSLKVLQTSALPLGHAAMWKYTTLVADRVPEMLWIDEGDQVSTTITTSGNSWQLPAFCVSGSYQNNGKSSCFIKVY